MALIRAVARSTVSGAVQGAGMISTSGTRCGGLIGCTTRQRCLFASPSVKDEAGRPEVELARMVFGSARASSRS